MTFSIGPINWGLWELQEAWTVSPAVMVLVSYVLRDHQLSWSSTFCMLEATCCAVMRRKMAELILRKLHCSEKNGKGKIHSTARKHRNVNTSGVT